MKTVYLTRLTSSDFGTHGFLSVPEKGFSCFTGEPPWRGNKRSISCIPNGVYTVKIRNSPKYGKVYHVKNVKDRSYILIHSGNYSGDSKKGLITHTQGCILLGSRLGWLNGQKCVLNSRITVRKFMGVMNNENFKMIIS